MTADGCHTPESDQVATKHRIRREKGGTNSAEANHGEMAAHRVEVSLRLRCRSESLANPAAFAAQITAKYELKEAQ